MEMTFKYEPADATDIGFALLQKLRTLGLKPIRVPIRKNGLSSKGDYRMCHANVIKMVNKYGGKRLDGHEIKIWDNDEVDCRHHSVWITPENRVVCITKANYDKETLEKGYVVFIPRLIDESCGIRSKCYCDFVIYKNKIMFVDRGGNRIGKTQLLKNARPQLNEVYTSSSRLMLSVTTFLDDRTNIAKRIVKEIALLKRYGLGGMKDRLLRSVA